jgi:hypothetical protein
MKKIFLAVLLMPIIVFSQTQGDYFVQYNYGQVFDRYNTDDINLYSPDVQTEFEGRDDVRMGKKYSFGYYIFNQVTLGIDYMDADISGANSIEYYNGKFNEANIFLNYEIKESNGIIFFGTVSYGYVEFDSKRYFVFDNAEISLNTANGTSQKFSYGAGISYKLKPDVEISLSIIDAIVDDGFDGWDYGSGSDQYLYQSIGVRIYL